MAARRGTGSGLLGAAGAGALAAALLASCAAATAHRQAHLAAAEGGDAALRRLESLDTGSSRLLYLYERGLMLHDAGDYGGSNESLARAEELLEDLYTRSLGREVGALLTGDYLVEYRGERFEAGLAHYYRIMNYLRTGAASDAAVESRRLNHRLQRYRDAGGGFYTDDPLLQYLTGLVYAAAGDRVAADVSLRAARDAYRTLGVAHGAEMPVTLLCDLAANAAALGRGAEAARHREEGACPDGAAGTGAVRLFIECGRVPFKVEHAIVVPIYRDEIGDHLDEDEYAGRLAGRRDRPFAGGRDVEHLLKVAVPRMHPAPGPITSARIRALAQGGERAGAESPSPPPAARAVVAGSPGALALASFAEREPEILVRAVGRALAKYLAARGARRDRGRAAGRIVNLVGVATEVADTRCWSSLPGKILVGGLDVRPGTYRIEVELFGDARRVGFVAFDGVEVRGGRLAILSHRAR